MPAKLEVIDYNPARRAKPAMGGGAYNPYERPLATGDTVRSRRPRIDLRQLSEWIKTTQQVKTLHDDAVPAEGSPKNSSPPKR